MIRVTSWRMDILRPRHFEKIARAVLKLLGNDMLRNPSMLLPVSEQAARNDRRMH